MRSASTSSSSTRSRLMCARLIDRRPIASAPIAPAPTANAPIANAPKADAPVEDAPVDAEPNSISSSLSFRLRGTGAPGSGCAVLQQRLQLRESALVALRHPHLHQRRHQLEQPAGLWLHHQLHART